MHFFPFFQSISYSFANRLYCLEVRFNSATDKHFFRKISKNQNTSTVLSGSFYCVGMGHRITYWNKYDICVHHTLGNHLRWLFSRFFTRFHYAYNYFSTTFYRCRCKYLSNTLLHHIRNYQDIFSCSQRDTIIHNGPCSLHHERIFHSQNIPLPIYIIYS